jgi:hypothetical protein
MAKKPPVEIKEIGDEVFVLVDGVKIAMRGARIQHTSGDRAGLDRFGAQ